MAIELSDITFTDQDDIVPVSGVEQILNTRLTNTLAGNDITTGTGRYFGIFNSSTINTTNGNDIITGISNEENSDNSYPPIYGIFNGKAYLKSIGSIFDPYFIIDTGGEPIIGDIPDFNKDTSTIYIGNGDDTLIGIAADTGNSTGIRNHLSIINTHDGSDTIIATGANGLVNNRGIIDTGKGNDIITGTGSNSHGIINSFLINTGDDNDTVTGIGNYYGILNYRAIDIGNGDDIITGISTTGNNDGIYNVRISSLDTGDGNDTITGIGKIGILNEGSINTGNGADSIIAEQGSDGSSTRAAIYNFGTINTGNGNDSIISQEKFINSGGVFLGEGNDLIIASTDLHDRALENFKAIETGDGDDIITSTGVIHNEGVINTGNGDDSIIVDAGLDSTGVGYAIYNNGGTIITGSGNDSIIANQGFGSGSNGSGAWFLGEEDDYIKGFGSGDFYGGNGNDTLELTPGSYIVGIWGEGETSVIFTKGNSLMITSEFEQLIAGGTIYNFASLTAGQTIVVA
jgi:hypothetical protein